MRSLRRFEYYNARTVEEAVSILKRYGGKAWPMAGGTDLLTILRFQPLPEDAYPAALVNLKTVSPSLEYIREEDGVLHVGALTRLYDIATNTLVRERYGALAEACSKVGSPHIREMGTIGGNITQITRCWYFRKEDNRFQCLRKGSGMAWAMLGDNRYHSIFGSAKIKGAEPCVDGCPNHIDIPSHMRLLRAGDALGALKRLLDLNPMPSITGRVCPHYCEERCNRKILDSSVGIRAVERFLGDLFLERPGEILGPLPKDKGNVAVVGSGPSGLSAAYYLRRKGYAVTILEREDGAGGVLSYGIPPFRLPREILQKTLSVFTGLLGVEIRLNVEVGRDVSVEELMGRFDAVLVATGAWKERMIGVPGEELLGRGVDFLKGVAKGSRELPGRHVAVVGGGNVGIDVARVLLRMGAEPVILEKEMLPTSDEMRSAQEEGVRVELLTEPIAFRRKGNKIGITCRKRKTDVLGGGSLPIEGSEFEMEVDAVLKAIGEAPDLSILPKGYRAYEGGVRADGMDFRIRDNLFACGDFLSGPTTVASAIASGRRAADCIDHYLDKGLGEHLAESTFFFERVNVASLQKKRRLEPDVVPVNERIRSLEREDVAGLTEEQVKYEAERCFDCGCVMAHPSDVAPALVVLDGKVITNKRVIPIEEFFRPDSLNTTVLEEDEVMLELQIPRPKGKSKFMKFSLRSSIDFPIVNCAARVELEDGVVRDIRVCLNAVFPVPFRARTVEDCLRGKRIGELDLQAAVERIEEQANPLPYNAYKVQIAKALVKRTIMSCMGAEEGAY